MRIDCHHYAITLQSIQVWTTSVQITHDWGKVRKSSPICKLVQYIDFLELWFVEQDIDYFKQNNQKADWISGLYTSPSSLVDSS